MSTRDGRNRANILRLLRNRKYGDAIFECNGYLKVHPDDYEIYRCRARAYTQTDQFQSAIDDFSRCVQMEPNEPHNFFMRGHHYLLLKNYKNAIEDFTQVLRLSRKHNSDYYREMAFFHRAESYLRLKLYDLAERDCHKVRDDMSLWIDSLRSKSAILKEALEGKSRATRKSSRKSKKEK